MNRVDRIVFVLPDLFSNCTVIFVKTRRHQILAAGNHCKIWFLSQGNSRVTEVVNRLLIDDVGAKCFLEVNGQWANSGVAAFGLAGAIREFIVGRSQQFFGLLEADAAVSYGHAVFQCRRITSQ